MALSRRALLKATATLAAISAAGVGRAGVNAEAAGDGATGAAATALPDAAVLDASPPALLRLWYPRPATQWVEALPLGNGRLGAMVWGGGKHERIQLNEDTLYAGGPYDPTPTVALAALPKVRELLFAGHYAEAEALANATMMATPKKQMPYQPLADLVLDFFEISETNGYRRELDLATAVAMSTFEARGLQHRREVFVSPVDQLVAVRLSGDKRGRISLRIGLDTDQPDATIDADGGVGLLLKGGNQAAFGIDGKLRYALRLQVQARGGSLRRVADRIEVRDADEVVL
ncbi:MAG: glycoside hydrolase family 95 protein, partial [Pseudoxanthomonas sp.]